MRGSTASWWFPLLYLFAIANAIAADPLPPPRIVSVSAGGHSIYVTFDQPMLSWSGDGEPPGVRIEPAFDCRWSWSDDRWLSCDAGYPGTPLKRAQRYRLVVGPGLWSQQGQPLPPQSLLVDSDRPTIDARTDWSDRRHPVIELSANVPLREPQLREVLLVTRTDGSAEAYTLSAVPHVGEDAAKAQNWRLAFDPNADDRRVAMRLRPGLRTDDGDLRGTQDLQLAQVRLDEPFELRRIGCDSTTLGADAAALDVQCSAGAPLLLEFSDAPSRASLDAWRANLPDGLQIDDDDATHATFSGTASIEDGLRPGHVVVLIGKRAHASFAIAIPATLRTDDGMPIRRAATATLRTTDFLPRFALRPSQLLLPVGAKATIGMRALNQPAFELEQREIAAGGRIARTHERHAATPTNRETPLTPAPPSDAGTRGGFVEGTARLTSQQQWDYPRYALDWAPFNLTVQAGKARCLVWVTRWEGATAVVDADIEVLEQVGTTDELRTIARARSDADGVAALDLPQPPAGTRFVRATLDGVRAILPLESALPVAHDARLEEAGDVLDDGKRIAWGVTDRPLYRAGDTVRYRLWLREREGNRFAALREHSRMHFTLAMWRDPVLSFDADPDAWGSVHGELQLPQGSRDGDYCVDLADGHDYDHHGPLGGACFRVTAFHAGDSWTELVADRPLAFDGERIELHARAGYYSGGPLVGAKATVDSMLTPLRLEDAYPKYAAYRFVDPWARSTEQGSEGFEEGTPTDARTDASGVARLAVLLDNPEERRRIADEHREPIPFGTLEFSAYVTPSSQRGGAAATTLMRFSRHARFVGLKLDDWLLREDADPRVEAIVIDAAGNAIDDASVNLRFDAVGERENADADAATHAAAAPLATCALRSGRTTTCAFRPPAAGRYRLTASSDGAAPTSIERHAFFGNRALADDGKAPVTLALESSEADGHARFVLVQPFAKARVLFTAEHGRVLSHWIETVDAPVSRVEHALPAEWAPGVTIKATVLDAAADAFGTDARRAIAATASVEVPVTAPTRVATLELAADRRTVRPGDEVVLTVHNGAGTLRQLTLALVDDAVRALVPELCAQADPRGPSWLGRMADWGRIDAYTLAGWNRDPERAHVDPRGNWITVLDQVDHGGGNKLDSITVTGSNIRRVDIFTRTAATDHSLGRPQSGESSRTTALRARFAETAHWDDTLELAAGASTQVRVRLPDNLTRWHAIAWANDADGDFELAETTIEAQLPIEVRADVPARVFAGDATTLAASVRNHGAAPATVAATLRAEGAGLAAHSDWQATLATAADRRIEVAVRTPTPGRVDVGALARSPDDEDGVAASVEVASTHVRRRVPVAGWLPPAGVALRLPPLPDGAGDAAVQVEASRGMLVQAASWVDALRDYPHRCWEQILSRAVGAAAAERLGLAARWPDADAVIEQALAQAAQFQEEGGSFHFFVGDGGTSSAPSLYLTAYSVRALEFLATLGRKVPEGVLSSARGALASAFHERPGGRIDEDFHDLAAAAAAVDAKDVRPAVLAKLWSERADLRWSARADLAFARAAAGEDSGVRELRDAAESLGGRRSIVDTGVRWALASHALDQCAISDALAKLDHADDAQQVRLEYLRGLVDLQSGGATELDTQAMARCLMALVDAPEAATRMPLRVDAALGLERTGIDIAADQVIASARLPRAAGDDELRLQASNAPLASFVATLDYDIDGRSARRSAVGLGIERRYAVLRRQRWVDVAADPIREGDWVRVTLRVSNQGMRRYVAISDSVAGGMRPADLELAGVAGLDLRSAGGDGSMYFSTRKVDERNARFYADALPPGTHEIHYYAQATHAGRYAALPAVAELMYGSASVANTAADTVVIAKAASARP